MSYSETLRSKIFCYNFFNFFQHEGKIGAAQVPKSYHAPSGIKTFLSSAVAGLVMGIPILTLPFWVPTSIQMQHGNWAFVDNPKAPVEVPHNSSARYNDEGVPVSPGGPA